jgi:hypothetical protein
MPSSLGTFPRTWDESQEEGTCLFITRPPHYFPRPPNIIIIIIMRSTISTITMPLLALFANRFIVAQRIGLYIRPPEACVLYIKEWPTSHHCRWEEKKQLSTSAVHHM